MAAKGYHSTIDVTRIFNRSLVYWRLNSDDLQRLQQALPSIDAHFFLICHNDDLFQFPAWLLDHPKVLKLFAPHVRFSQVHPKLVPLPLGLNGRSRGAASQRLRAARALARAIPPSKSLFVKFQIGQPRYLRLRYLRRRRVLNDLRAAGWHTQNVSVEIPQVRTRPLLSPGGGWFHMLLCMRFCVRVWVPIPTTICRECPFFMVGMQPTCVSSPPVHILFHSR